MPEPLNVGVVGCGIIFPLNALGYQRTDRARIVALCDTNPAKLSQRKQELEALPGAPLVRTYTEYADLLNDAELHVIEILTPHHLHAPMAVAAAEAGKHVSVQKPMARTPSEIMAMDAAAQQAGVKIKCFESYVFYPPIVRAKELIDAGAIGDVRMVRCRSTGGALDCSWPLTAEAYQWRMNAADSGGGVMFDDMHHKYATALHLGGDVAEVFAFIENRDTYLDWPAAVSWKYTAPNRLGIMDAVDAPNLWMKTDYYAMEERFEITGTDGILWITRCTGTLFDQPPLVLHTGRETRTFNDVPYGWEEGFVASTHDFIDAILEDRDPALTCAHAIKVVQFALAAYKAHDERRPVSPDEICD